MGYLALLVLARYLLRATLRVAEAVDGSESSALGALTQLLHAAPPQLIWLVVWTSPGRGQRNPDTVDAPHKL